MVRTPLPRRARCRGQPQRIHSGDGDGRQQCSAAPPPPRRTGVDDALRGNGFVDAYTAGWTPDGSLSWSGGTAAFSTATGARATFTFTGPSVTWIGGRADSTGIARILLDGFPGRVDTFLKTLEVRVPMFQRPA